MSLPTLLNFADANAFRTHARAKLLGTPVVTQAGSAHAHVGPSDFDLNPDARPLSSPDAIPAAVLVPIMKRAELSVLLTERSGHLKAHAGQISFPGGRIEASDANPTAAALREAHEEVAIPACHVETLGYLEPYRTGTGFLITPVIALVDPNFDVCPDPNEVASVFEVPLSFLMNEENHKIDARLWRGAERRYYAMPYGERYIWGATAGIIRLLYRRLFLP